MKNSLFTIFFIIFCISGFTQGLEIVETEPIQKGKIGENIAVVIKIHNTSEEPVYLMVQRIDKQIGSTQSTYFCIEDDCFDKNIEMLPEPVLIKPGEISGKFISILEAGISEQYSTVNYLFFDHNNPSNSIRFDLNYLVEESTSRKLFYESKTISLSDVYPNPLADQGFIDYNLFEEDKEAKIMIHNVLGSVVGEYQLSPFENQVKISVSELNPGIYFYTLYLENKGIATKKLVIKR